MKKNSIKKIGLVVKTGNSKSITVSVPRLVKHPVYKKYIKKQSLLKVHDEKGKVKLGEKVEVIEARPFSKTKRWAFLRIVDAAKLEVEA